MRVRRIPQRAKKKTKPQQNRSGQAEVREDGEVGRAGRGLIQGKKSPSNIPKNVVSHLWEAKRMHTSEALQHGQRKIIAQGTTESGITYLIRSSDGVIWEP